MKENALLEELKKFLKDNNVKLEIRIKTGYDEGIIYQGIPRSQFISYDGVCSIDLHLEETGGW